MFIGRGIRQNRAIATSSLVFVVSKQLPGKSHRVEIVNYIDPNDEIETALYNILANKKIKRKKIPQQKLLENLANWNFIKQDKTTLEFFDTYNEKEAFDIYRFPEISKPKFNSCFYFDKGLVFPKDKISLQVPHNKDFFYLTKSVRDRFQLSVTNQTIKGADIRFPKGAQGIKVYEQRCKVIWRYMNPDKFYFTDKRVMINFNWILISSDNKTEMLYILSLLNSKVNKLVLESLLRSETEKDILIGIKTIKEFVRIPRITEENEFIKNEIIKQTQQMLSLEEIKLGDLVDFKNVFLQKCDDVKVQKDYLILTKSSKESKLKINNRPDLIKRVINELFGPAQLRLQRIKISLSELKSFPAIDFQQRDKIKDYIDDLVFALYFDIPLKHIGFDKAKTIKTACHKKKFYKFIEQNHTK